MKKIIPAVPEQIVSITCDCCQVKYDAIEELQECLSYEDTCGFYNKTFGDETQWSIDLCQYCIYNLLGKYIKKVTK